jgi:hypothetical protein
MGRFEWKVGVGTTTFFSCCASALCFGGRLPGHLADARVAGETWVIRSPVREQPLERGACLGGDHLDRDVGKIGVPSLCYANGPDALLWAPRGK